MRNLILGIAAAASLLSAGAAVNAANSPKLIFGVDRPRDMPTLDRVQFIYLNRNYCWYDGGWHGPGFYWCGYAWRSGFGWGGGWGWRGWYGHRGWNGWNGAAGWRGQGGGGGFRGGHGVYGPRGGGGPAAHGGGGRAAHGGGGRGGDHRPH